MASVDSQTKKYLLGLCTQQHRLRHLQGVSACNVDACNNLPEVALQFTMHVNESAPAFYSSEKCNDIVNPKWRNVDTSQFPDYINSSVSAVLIRVWCQHQDKKHVIIEWTIDFSGLYCIGEQVAKNDRKFKANTLILRMFELYYTAADSVQISNSNESANGNMSVLSVDSASLRNSYNFSSLQRIHTVQRAIKQTQVSIWKIHDLISGRLRDASSNEQRRAEKERLQMYITTLCYELQTQKIKLNLQKEQLSNMIGVIHDRSFNLINQKEALKEEKEQLLERRLKFSQQRELLLKTNAELALRKKKLLSELPYIYPIKELINNISIKSSGSKIGCLSSSIEVSNKGFTICNVHLPNSEDFAGHDETRIAVSLGYVTHLVSMIAQILDVPLRYPVRHLGSRSKVTDHIVDKLPDKDREFPLYSKGKDKLQFNYGVYLLNKNVSQLRYSVGLLTQDLRPTLANLQEIIEMDIGVRLEHQSSGHSYSDSRSVPSSSSNLEHKMNLLQQGSLASGRTLSFSMPPETPPPRPLRSSISGFSKAVNIRGDDDTVLPNGTVFSCSLDKGLDELEIKSSRSTNHPLRQIRSPSLGRAVALHSGSEPNLARHHVAQLVDLNIEGSPSSGEEIRNFTINLQPWAGTGSSRGNSEDDLIVKENNEFSNEDVH